MSKPAKEKHALQLMTPLELIEYLKVNPPAYLAWAYNLPVVTSNWPCGMDSLEPFVKQNLAQVELGNKELSVFVDDWKTSHCRPDIECCFVKIIDFDLKRSYDGQVFKNPGITYTIRLDRALVDRKKEAQNACLES